MAYMRFYNPYLAAFRDQHSDLAYDRLVNRYKDHSCGCANMPAANISENEKEYQIQMALPGVKKESITLNYENGFLTVTIAKNEVENEAEKAEHLEFDYNGASRVFKTGQKVNADQITANHENGILTIHLPKKEEYIKKPAHEIAIS